MTAIMERRLTSWDEFVQTVESLDQGSPYLGRYLFRGQACAAWSLDPRLARITRGIVNEDRAQEIERFITQEFQAQAHLYVPHRMVFRDDDVISQWGLMQHYGAPTRLLDWTFSPYVAAYVAANDHPDDDGAVWVINAQAVKVAARRTFKDRYPLPRTLAGQTKAVRAPSAKPVLYFTNLRFHTDRMAAQRMAFTLVNRVICDHAEAAMTLDVPAEALVKLVLPVEEKLTVMRRLRRMNITARSLFPGVDGLGRSAAELAHLEAAYKEGHS